MHESLGLVGWDWSLAVGAFGFGVGRLGLAGRRLCMRVWGWRVGVRHWGLCMRVWGGWVEKSSDGMCFSVWGEWVGVGWSQVGLESLGLVSWDQARMVCAFRFGVGGSSVVQGQRGPSCSYLGPLFGVDGLRLVNERLELGGWG